MKLDELKEHCLKTLKHTEKFPTKTFEEHALVLRLIENQTPVIAELEKIKIEIIKITFRSVATGKTKEEMSDKIIQYLDKRISEMKGENNET